MLRFKLFGFPISVHWMFWLAAILLGGGFSTGRGNPTIPLLAWTIALFTAILWHELGHAFFQRKYGGRPEIMIHGMGGYSSASVRLNQMESITVSFMGPFFGLLLGGAALLWLRNILPEELIKKIPPLLLLKLKVLPNNPSFLEQTLFLMIKINIFLSIVNLLPVLPLDGGKICEALFGPQRHKTVMLLGMITAGVAAVVLQFHYGQMFLAIFFGYFAYQNYKAYKQGYGKPNLPF